RIRSRTCCGPIASPWSPPPIPTASPPSWRRRGRTRRVSSTRARGTGCAAAAGDPGGMAERARGSARGAGAGSRRAEDSVVRPSMSAASMATARLMETWAHGLDVADALGVQREATPRLRSVARRADLRAAPGCAGGGAGRVRTGRGKPDRLPAVAQGGAHPRPT
ncbi:maleylpyruvate isomerase N-terminal domain-containing protein, partial [Mycolicibacterium insubricum]|nr:maleylpyruvate isomerase N-terminal domain-containing protein [Mycolicibacterium insubricum]